jgi:hypothetical protein
MITWKFNELPITFKSTEANLSRDILKMAHANHIDPSSLITIIDGNTNNIILADAPGSHGNPSTVLQPTLPVGAKKTKTAKHKTDVVPPVSGDVDNVDIKSDSLDILNYFGDTDQSGNWLDSEPDGQDAH